MYIKHISFITEPFLTTKFNGNASSKLFRCLTNKNDSASVASNSGGNLRCTVKHALDMWHKELKKQNVPEPKESAEYIITHVLGSRKVSDLYRNSCKLLNSDDIHRIKELCNLRIQRMPVQYIIQEWDFRDLTLKMSRPVFIPRPETEMFVDIVLNEIDVKGVDTILELCCGSGAISLALLKSRPQLYAVAIDKSENACELAKENARLNKLSYRLRIIRSEITTDNNLNPITNTYDIIVSNPPYVPSKDMDNLQLEIKLFEDPGALDGGMDGLVVIKSILNACSRLLNRNGKLFLEVDPTHPELIHSWLLENNRLELEFVRSFKDFCGKERFVEVTKRK